MLVVDLINDLTLLAWGLIKLGLVGILLFKMYEYFRKRFGKKEE